jgi:hypothetical protein
LERSVLVSSSFRQSLLGAVAIGYAAIFARTDSMEGVWWAIYFLLLALLADRMITFGMVRVLDQRNEAHLAARPTRAGVVRNAGASEKLP